MKVNMNWILNVKQLYNYLAITMLEGAGVIDPSDQDIQEFEDHIKAVLKRLGLTSLQYRSIKRAG